jgi:ARG and Rhodanese-Phosphatase-superfamily-associated Protein domain
MTSTLSAPSTPFHSGDAQSHHGLALIPLFADESPVQEYIGLDEALAHGLAITEINEAGSVTTLAVSNPLDVAVLLFEGEELAGAKQNRVLDRTILVPAGAKISAPVNCVERGRWTYRSDRFKTAPRSAHLTQRYASRVGGQHAVWSEISAKSARLGAISATEASEAMYVDQANGIDEYLQSIPRRPGQSGAIVCVAGRVVCLDYVSRSEVYAGLHAKLLRGYALDAIERPTEAPVPAQYIEKFLARLGRARRGSGELRARGLVGTDLAVDGELIALSVFSTSHG